MKTATPRSDSRANLDKGCPPGGWLPFEHDGRVAPNRMTRRATLAPTPRKLKTGVRVLGAQRQRIQVPSSGVVAHQGAQVLLPVVELVAVFQRHLPEGDAQV